MKKDFKGIDERTFEFALLIINLNKYLPGIKEYVLSKQLLRSGTSIGANVHESQAAQSKRDFIAKMAIASKEARETGYGLRLLDKAEYLSEFDRKQDLFSEVSSIINILTKIVKTSKENISK